MAISAVWRRIWWIFRAPAIRLGHALRGVDNTEVAALNEALEILHGNIELKPRPPLRSGVLEAEALLDPTGDRYVYAFVGALHSDLGSVGLIISRGWAERATVGVTRCDTGGLRWGYGGFGCLPDADRPDAMKSILVACQPFALWWKAFCAEVRRSYSRSFEGYVAGDKPEHLRWVDVRPQCIDHADTIAALDRRLWTWEVRLGQSPRQEDFECLVISPQNEEYLRDLYFRNIDVPENVRILSLDFLSDGLHWFETQDVQNAFLGVLARI